jgi:hypothetical protein
LFYLGLDGSLFGVNVELSAEHVKPSAPQKLFQTTMSVLSSMGQQYDFTPDGDRAVSPFALPPTSISLPS